MAPNLLGPAGSVPGRVGAALLPSRPPPRSLAGSMPANKLSITRSCGAARVSQRHARSSAGLRGVGLCGGPPRPAAAVCKALNAVPVPRFEEEDPRMVMLAARKVPHGRSRPPFPQVSTRPGAGCGRGRSPAPP